MNAQTSNVATPVAAPTGTAVRRGLVFAGYAWAIAAPLWLGVSLLSGLCGIEPWTICISVAIVGVILSAPASMAQRLLAPRIGRTLAIIIGAAGFGTAWWLISRWPFASLSEGRIAGEIFLGTLLFASNDVFKGARNRVRAARAARRFANPRALASDSFLDTYLIVDAIEKAANAPGMPASALPGMNWLKQQISTSANPSLRQPQPLPYAVAYALHDLELRSAALGGKCDLRADPARLPSDRFIEPVLLAHLVGFAFHYSGYMGHNTACLTLTFREGESEALHLTTGLRRDEHWFKLAENSTAEIAKMQLVEMLNRFSRSGHFAVTQNPEGFLCFSLGVQRTATATAEWSQIESQLPPEAELVSNCPRSLGMSRVYRIGGRIWKIGRNTSESTKSLTLEEEYQVLRRLDGIEGAPQKPQLRSEWGYKVLSYDHIDGMPLNRYLVEQQGKRPVWVRCLAALTQLLDQIHERGVSHCDIRPENVLVGGDGSVSLIDFDRAAIAGLKAERAVDVNACAAQGIHACCALVRDLIPKLGLEKDYADVARELCEIWKVAGKTNANSPGEDIAYYAWNFGDLELPGERPWRHRWQLILPVLKPFLKGAGVLDLGCNMGMLSTHCLLHGAAHVTSVDHEAPIIEVAKRLAAVVGVELDTQVGDLNRPEFVAQLASQPYDIAIALSVVYWLENKEAVLQLLASTPRVLFEGHLPPDQEIKSLRALGFRKVEIVGYSERLRGLYLASND